MKVKKLSQEGLKLIACVTMLLDHIGAVLIPWVGLRIIGRLAFPIYCFLLTEGAARTRDPKKYGLRLLIGMLLAELPFDLLFYGSLTWQHQSVMVTLLLGYLMILWMQRMEKAQAVAFIVCAAVAEMLCTDYGAWGMMIIALFTLTREREDRNSIWILSLVLVGWLMGGTAVAVGPIRVPVQVFGVLSLIPISLYSGRKATTGKAVQWLFYLFYPVHLLVLWMVTLI